MGIVRTSFAPESFPAGQAHVALGVPLESEARPGERDARAEREWEAERQELRPAVADELPAQVHVEHRTGDRDHLEA